MFVALLTVGCQAEARHVYSEPRVESNKDVRLENGTIFLPDLEIWILSQNRRGMGLMVYPVPMPIDPGDDFSRPYQITISIKPKVDSFSFDPGKLILWVNTEVKSVPQRIKSGVSTRGVVPLETFAPSPIRLIPLRRDVSTTLTLEFDIYPPDPSDTFFLDIEGLTRFGEPYTVPRLRFEKATFRGPMR
jgi:hypothetical protein